MDFTALDTLFANSRFSPRLVRALRLHARKPVSFWFLLKESFDMKRLAIVAAVLLVAACTAREETPADTAAPALAPMPDTGMRMDTMPMDTARRTTQPRR
jgi:hypothetical protein